jgi:hypothetical protein
MKEVWLSALRTGLLYSPGNIPGTRLCYRLVDLRAKVRPESGIETATFRLVVQCLKQMRHRVAPLCIGTEPIFKQLKYACLILNTYHPDILYLDYVGKDVRIIVIFRNQKGPVSRKVCESLL